METNLRAGVRDLFSICRRYKLYILAVESKGVAFRVEKGGKKPKTYYLKSGARGVRLDNEVSVALDKITDSKNALLVVNHPEWGQVQTLKSALGSLVVSRRRAEQLIIDGGKAVVTLMALNESRCCIHINHAGRCSERYLILGDRPLLIMDKIHVEYVQHHNDQARLKFIAPKHVSIDRHEVHLKKEYDVQTISDKRAEYTVKSQSIKKVVNA